MENNRTDGTNEHPLTLKTLYRMLTQPDYPVHSYAVFPEKQLYGQTLSRFWHTLFQKGLPEGTDLSVFDATQRRSRSLTKLLNSSGNAGFLHKWYDDLSTSLSRRALMRLNQAWMDRLEAWNYAPDALTLRLKAYMEGLLVEEPLKPFFTGLWESCSSGADTSMLFRHGLMLSWLTLYALYGSRMQDVHLNRLRAETEGTPLTELYRLYTLDRLSRQPQVISERQCTLCVQPMPAESFFGREKELNRAAEIMHAGGKLIVQGIGGIGKTEFVRQLLQVLRHSGIWTQLAFVQYEGKLSTSLVQAFPALRKTSSRDRVSAARRLLEEPSSGKTLLLIDNLSESAGRDPALGTLASWGCDMIITSRLAPLDGFTPLVLEGLEKEDSRKLFLHLDEQALPGDVETLCDFTRGHPLAITLFANLCSRRYWPVSRLLKELDEYGLSNLSYVRQAAPLHLADVFERTFSTASLTDPQTALMRLFSLLPYRYWLPDALISYARDIHDDSDTLADSCQTLCDLGMLLSGPEGYAIHPLIAETILHQHIRADDYPRLCRLLLESADGEDDLPRRALILCVTHMSELNLALVRAITRAGQLLGRTSDVDLPEKVYPLIRKYLDTHPHEDADETDYWLSLGIRDIVTFSSLEHLGEYLQHVVALGPDSIKHRACLYTVLEYAIGGKTPEVVDQVFAMLHPQSDGDDMVDYLISYSVKQREMDHDPAAAILSLQKAEELLRHAHEDNSGRLGNLLYRWATCELDLSRPEQAKPLLEDCLRIMKENGHPDHNANVMNTRGTYAFTLSQLKEYDEALRQYRKLAEMYRLQQRERSSSYSTVCSNMAMILDQTGKHTEAKRFILEALQIDKELSPSDATRATHLRHAGLILAHCGEYKEAAAYAERALSLRQSVFGEDSPLTADTRAVLALSQAHTGDVHLALSQARSACSTMEARLGSSHRCTVAGHLILEEIEKMCSECAQTT